MREFFVILQVYCTLLYIQVLNQAKMRLPACLNVRRNSHSVKFCVTTIGVCIFRCADCDCLCTFFNLQKTTKGGLYFFFGIQIKKRANFIASQRIIRKRCPLVQNRFNNVTVTHPLRTNAYRFSGGMRSFWGLWRFYK